MTIHNVENMLQSSHMNILHIKVVFTISHLTLWILTFDPEPLSAPMSGRQTEGGVVDGVGGISHGAQLLHPLPAAATPLHVLWAVQVVRAADPLAPRAGPCQGHGLEQVIHGWRWDGGKGRRLGGWMCGVPHVPH